METKFIIVKDKNGRLRKFKSDWLHHETIARDNGFSSKDILVAGMFLDKKLFILECSVQAHKLRRANRYIGNAIEIYQDARITSWLRGRELESQLYYSKKAVGLREGD